MLRIFLSNIFGKHVWQISLASLALVRLKMKLPQEPQNYLVVFGCFWYLTNPIPLILRILHTPLEPPLWNVLDHIGSIC